MSYNTRTRFFDASVAVGTTAEQVLGADPSRTYLEIQAGAVDVYVGFDEVPTTSSKKIPAGTSWAPAVAPTNSISLLGSAAGNAVVLWG